MGLADDIAERRAQSGGWCPDCLGTVGECQACAGTGLCDEVRAELAIDADPYAEARDDARVAR